jgi:hypothetical protein
MTSGETDTLDPASAIAATVLLFIATSPSVLPLSPFAAKPRRVAA